MTFGTIKDWITLIGVFVGPWAAVKLSIHQFRAQKWWEKQVDVYFQLLQALSGLKWSCTQHYNHEIGLRNFADDSVNRCDELKVLTNVVSYGSYIVSEATTTAVTDLLEMFYNPAGTSKHQIVENELAAVENCLKAVRREANRISKRPLRLIRFWKLSS